MNDPVFDLAEKLVDSEVGPHDLGMDAAGGAYWALSMVGALADLVEKGWTIEPPSEEGDTPAVENAFVVTLEDGYPIDWDTDTAGGFKLHTKVGSGKVTLERHGKRHRIDAQDAHDLASCLQGASMWAKGLRP